jgi:hypothetical protein
VAGEGGRSASELRARRWTPAGLHISSPRHRSCSVVELEIDAGRRGARDRCRRRGPRPRSSAARARTPPPEIQVVRVPAETPRPAAAGRARKGSPSLGRPAAATDLNRARRRPDRARIAVAGRGPPPPRATAAALPVKNLRSTRAEEAATSPSELAWRKPSPFPGGLLRRHKFLRAPRRSYSCDRGRAFVWTSVGPLPRWVPGPTTRWAPGTTRLALHDT